MKPDLKNYVCLNPFKILEMHEYFHALCVPEWLLKYIPVDTKVEDIWNSDVAKQIRESVTDGSFKFCDTEQCPYLSHLLRYNEVDEKGPIIHKLKLPQNFFSEKSPSRIDFDFDRTCNYKCPSCRKSVYTADKEKIEEVKNTITEIENVFGGDVEELYLSASGDPFASVSYRNFLRNFDPLKFPKLKNIHFHTNASNWSKEMWETIPNVHSYVGSCEISIDAATKETYETKVRLNGKWDRLIENLKFISTIKSLKLVKLSFVTQQKNYKEMKMFVDLMKGIFGKKLLVLFVKINNWGTFTEEEFLKEKVWDKSHPEHTEFIEEVMKIHGDSQVYHNFHEFIVANKNLI